MQTVSYKLPRVSGLPSLSLAFGVLVALFVLVLSGMLVVVLPPLLLALLIIIPAVMIGGILRPELAIALLLLIAVGFFPQNLLPVIGILGGAVRFEDLLLVALGGIWLIRALFGMTTGRLPKRFTLIMLFIVLMVMFASAFRAGFYLGVDQKAAIAELRTYFYLAPLVLIPLLINSEQTAHRLWHMIIGVMLLLALGQAIQGLFGFAILHGGRLETEVTLGQTHSDSIRSTVPGIFLLIFGLHYGLACIFSGSGKWRFLWIPAIGLFAIAILLTYGRAIWLTTVLGVLVLSLSFGPRRMMTFSLLSALLIALTLAGISYFKPAMIDSIGNRMTSVTAEVQGGSSLEWRRMENIFAMRKINEAPVLGVGLGASYRPIAGGLDTWVEQTRFIHNGYLYLQLKTGLIGLTIFAVFWFSMLRIGWLHARHTQGEIGLIGRCYLIVGLLPIVTGFVRPEWADQGTLVVFATLGGLLLAFARTEQTPGARQATNIASPAPLSA